MPLCECQCGGEAAEGKRFIRGHQLKLKENRQRLKCSACCPACHQHFTGTAAFDAHLKRVNHRKNRFDVTEYDLKHLTGQEAGLEVAVQDGHCDVGAKELTGVTVWRLPLGAKAADDDEEAEVEADSLDDKLTELTRQFNAGEISWADFLAAKVDIDNERRKSI